MSSQASSCLSPGGITDSQHMVDALTLCGAGWSMVCMRQRHVLLLVARVHVDLVRHASALCPR
ncbi:putative leader peptide [Micromonospora sp. NPDC049523]|uniref:putative leader peptide n=1 Tax=Micromonospora sp. NPDC049523 TaxID=3155921 RepID=UPI003425C416